MQFLIYHLLKYILFIGADVKSQPCTQKVMEFYYTDIPTMLLRILHNKKGLSWVFGYDQTTK